MDFLALCKDFVSEYGLAGLQGPSSVLNQRGELNNVVRWVRQSCLYVDNLWRDWDYHWFEYSGTIEANHRDPTAAQFTVGHWDRQSFWLDKSSSNPTQLRFMPWEQFRFYTMGTANQQPARPTHFTVRPDRSLLLHPVAETQHELTSEAWRRPFVLTNDNDMPLMPEQFHRIINVRAAIMYGNREDAPEIIAGAEAEYVDLLEKLQADQAPSFSSDRDSSPDVPLYGSIPGRE